MISEEQQELVTAVRGLLAKRDARAGIRKAMDTELGYDPRLWAQLCEQVGVAALAIPEEFGGFGAGLAESLLVVGEIGRTLADVPMLGSAVLGVQAVLLSGDVEACARLLPGVAEGRSTLAVCWASARGWDDFGVRADGESRDGTAHYVRDGTAHYVLDGTAHYVLDGTAADTLIVVTESGLFEVDPAAAGVERRRVAAMDPSRGLSEISFTAVPARRLGDADPGPIIEQLHRIAWAAVAAEQVGAAEYCLEATVEYTKSRVQFGRAIGSFQALKHRMADMYVLAESAKSASLAATFAVAGNTASAAEDVWVARRQCSESFSAIAAETVQLHGGIAITWEHDAHLYFKRAHGDAELFGVPRRPLVDH
ncbi:acyl-CoA dehydrogenase family protein [Nocardia sp. NBC_01329]|uniref:acyl-CoA dehydrogenase family protein n=1 Tax=Nocardia sp. NBC_01329 TaxID=2903594 RepID=UPI002E13D2BB|nr:acyl-CoA/acyl-ACP dehydrogenase [Nocardia sp. NBC_01329]